MKIYKKVLSLMLICFLIQTFLPMQQFCLGLNTVVLANGEENTIDFAGGNGTEENPYKVANHFHLNNVRNYLDAYYIQTNDIDLTAATAEDGAFYYDGLGWLPIGDTSTVFTGLYNGGGYTIIGLKSARGGLFNYNNGTIKNLGMVDVNISRSYYYSSYYLGGIVGDNSGAISNCYNTGNVSGSSPYPSSHTGGIVGNNSGTIIDCYNTGNVSSPSSYTGGIVGDNSGAISNCYNTGHVSGSSSYSSYTGGIAGWSESGTISNCYNTGNVLGYSPSYPYTGGIVGWSNSGTISNCYNIADISAVATDGIAYAGGLVGYANYATVSFGYSIGEVSATVSTTCAGKVIGCNQGLTLSRLYYIGTSADLGIGNEGNRSGAVEFRTEEQMKTPSSLTGFDFSDIWDISPNANDGYPTLRNVPVSNSDSGNEVGEYSITYDMGNTGYWKESEVSPNVWEWYMPPSSYNAGDIVTLPTAADFELTANIRELPDLVFLGWYDNAMREGEPITAISSADTGNKMYYAKWYVEGSFIITVIDSNNGNRIEYINPNGYNGQIRDVGYSTSPQWGGWYQDSNFTIPAKSLYYHNSIDLARVLEYEPDTETEDWCAVSENITVYAKWIQEAGNGTETFTITYETNGGNSIDSRTINPIGSSGQCALLSKPIRNGYVFLGWFEDSAFTIPSSRMYYHHTVKDLESFILELNMQLADDGLVPVTIDECRSITQNITVYAKWEKHQSSNVPVDEYGKYIGIADMYKTSIYSAKSIWIPAPIVSYEGIVPVMAFYNGNKMVSVVVDIDYIVSGDMLRLDMSKITVPKEITSLKILAWESLENLTPLIDAHTVE